MQIDDETALPKSFMAGYAAALLVPNDKVEDQFMWAGGYE